MPSLDTLDRLRELYPKLSDMEPSQLNAYLGSLLRVFETRAWGNYEGCTIDNLTLLEECATDGDPVMAFKGTDRLQKLWRKYYWPQVRQKVFKFYSLDDFVNFHLPFSQKHPAIECQFYLEGPEDDQDFFGQHTHCRLIDGYSRGCEICELLYVLDLHSHPYGKGLLAKKIRQRAFQGEDGVEFGCCLNGEEVKIKGRWKEEMQSVVGLVVSGFLGELSWAQREPIDDLDEPPKSKAVVAEDEVNSYEADDELSTDDSLETGCSATHETLSSGGEVDEVQELALRRSYASINIYRPKTGDGPQTVGASSVAKNRDSVLAVSDIYGESAAHLICMHDVTRKGYLHCMGDGICWETPLPVPIGV